MLVNGAARRRASFRVFLRNPEQRIVGRFDFEADDAPSAMKIAGWIAQSCSDDCAADDVLQDGGRLVSSSTARVEMNGTSTALNDLERRIAIDAMIALRGSVWRIGKSERLLAALDDLQNCDGGRDGDDWNMHAARNFSVRV